MRLRELHDKKLLCCIHLYPHLDPEGFELEARDGLEGRFLLECVDFDFELWCLELCFELWCFELCFELWCFELGFLLEDLLGCFGGFDSLGGYSSRGSLISRHLPIPGNTLALRLDLSLLRPLLAMSN